MELEHYQKIAVFGFILAALFGAIANRTNFCTMGAISDWVNMGALTRLKVWLLAMGIALVGTQIMHSTGAIDVTGSIYLSTNFTWLGYIVGGFIFGIGMTIGSGCGQKTLVRVGGGNLKSLVVLIVMGITAYMTLRGLLALIRLQINDPTTIDLSESGLATQGIPDILSAWTGLSSSLLGIVLTVLIGGGAIVYALKDASVRNNFDHMLSGIGIGLLIAASWYVTGVLGYDDFEPLPLEGISFISPVGNTISYLMTYTGSVINFGIAVVFGMIAGSFLYAILTGTFRVESFNDQSDLVHHLWGGALMGFGGVMALGCTIGQGVTGMSTLAAGSLIAALSICLGCAFALKMQYYLYDEQGWWHAFKSTMGDVVPSKQKSA
ncbi:MAG: YeeE/YedE family protein [bacterium]